MSKTIKFNTLRTIVITIPIQQVLMKMFNHCDLYFIAMCTRRLAKLPVANVATTTIIQKTARSVSNGPGIPRRTPSASTPTSTGRLVKQLHQ